MISGVDRAVDLRCYVINLPRRLDRRIQIAAQIPSSLPVQYTSDWEECIDGQELDRQSLRASGLGLHPWSIESDNPWWSRPLKWGEVGCAIAHLACWRAAVEEGVDYALVLEDDAVLRSGFVGILHDTLDRLRGSVSFDLLYLGRFPLESDLPTEIPGLVIPGYSHCTFGYLLSRIGLKIALSAGLDRTIIPVDEFLPALYHPHPRADLRQRFPPVLSALAFEPPLVTQRPKHEAGSDTEESAFVEPAGGYELF